MNEEQVPDTIEKLYDRLDDYDKQQLMNYGYLMEYTRTLEKEVKYQNGIVIKQKEILDKIKEIAKENTDTGWMRPEIIEGAMIFKNGLALEILELLEEIE